ncbi:MAG: glycosyltransferase family 39 protein [Chloroflexota bacterium]
MIGRIALAAALAGYALLPGHPGGLLRGIPLGPWGVGFLLGQAVAAYALWPTPRVRWPAACGAALVIACIVKLVLWALAPEYGLAATYWGRSRATGSIERSTEYPGRAYTRVETQPGSPLALYFFNDTERFNNLDPGQPDRRMLPFVARWSGYVRSEREGEVRFQIVTTGNASLTVGDAAVAAVDGRGSEAAAQGAASISSSPTPITIQIVHPSGAEPLLVVDWDRGGGFEPLGPDGLTVNPVAAEALRRDVWFARLAVALDMGVVLGTVAFWSTALAQRRSLDRERLIVGGLLGLAVAHALITSNHLQHEAVILEGGQDWLTYETYARDILLNGPLMTLGKSLGQGRPYFFQPFYPYYLAGMHWLTGEGLWGPTVLQLTGLGLAGLGHYYLTRALFGVRAGAIYAALFLILHQTQLDWVARKMLSENLYFIILPFAIWTLVRFAASPAISRAVCAGLLLGVAAITRAPTLAYVPLAAGISLLASRRLGVRWSSTLAGAAYLCVAAAAIAGLVPLRNYVVSGRPALVATNGGATLHLAHAPPPHIRLSGVDRDPLYNALRLDRFTREVMEFARQDPAGYLATLVPLALYTIGIPNGIEGQGTVAPDILAITLGYALALLLSRRTRTLPCLYLHAFIALHFVVMVTFLPYVYGYRQVLPMTLLMLVIAAGAAIPGPSVIGGFGTAPARARAAGSIS